MQDNRIKLSVQIITYNHVRYIARALEGALMQKTDFDFEIVVGDDCSTDGTREILLDFKKRYPEKINLILNEINLGAIKNFLNVHKHCRGEFIAWVEGDDYWTNPDKLQKQVDFLEAHPDYSMVFHNAIRVDEEGKEEIYCREDLKYKTHLPIEELITCNIIPSHSVVFRDTYKNNVPEWMNDLMIGDWPFHILNAAAGKIGYIDEIMGVYRYHSAGYWTSSSEAKRAIYTIQFYSAINKHFNYEYDDIIQPIIRNFQIKLLQYPGESHLYNLLDFDLYIHPFISLNHLDTYLIRYYTLRSLKKMLPLVEGNVLDIYKDKPHYQKLFHEAPCNITGYKDCDIMEENCLQQLPNNMFDTVIMVNSIENSGNPLQLLEEAKRVLKNEGNIILITSGLDSIAGNASKFRFTKASLGGLLKEADFENFNIEATGGTDASLAHLIGLWLIQKKNDEGNNGDLVNQIFPFYLSLLNYELKRTVEKEEQMVTGYAVSVQKFEEDMKGDISELIISAYNFITTGKFKEAINLLDIAENNYIHFSGSQITLEDINNFKGIAFLNLDNLDKALQAFESALRANPSSSRACEGIGEVFIRKGMLPEAKTMLEWALKNDPDNSGAKMLIEQCNCN